jgi:hypothetical protein
MLESSNALMGKELKLDQGELKWKKEHAEWQKKQAAADLKVKKEHSEWQQEQAVAKLELKWGVHNDSMETKKLKESKAVLKEFLDEGMIDPEEYRQAVPALIILTYIEF